MMKEHRPCLADVCGPLFSTDHAGRMRPAHAAGLAAAAVTALHAASSDAPTSSADLYAMGAVAPSPLGGSDGLALRVHQLEEEICTMRCLHSYGPMLAKLLDRVSSFENSLASLVAGAHAVAAYNRPVLALNEANGAHGCALGEHRPKSCAFNGAGIPTTCLSRHIAAMGSSGSGTSVMSAEVVMTEDAMEQELRTACIVTVAGSITPVSNRFSYESVAAFQPKPNS